LRSKFSKGNSGKAKSPNKTAAPAALLTAIDKSGGTGIPRELGETFIVAVRFQRGTDRGILLHRFLSPLVSLNPGLLRHSRLGNYRRDWKIQTTFSQGAIPELAKCIVPVPVLNPLFGLLTHFCP
jgi:hypothetical protein